MLALSLIVGIASGAYSQGAPAAPPVAPVYRFSVELNTEEHTLSGRMEVELPPGDPRSTGELLFHLPPNRFREPDKRGNRRNISPLSFSTGFRLDPQFDPLAPDGFSEGGIDILRVENRSGERVTYAFEDNPLIPHGYSPQQGLMRVDLSRSENRRFLVIQFRTRLPYRYWDGWSEEGILAEQWHPVLANRKIGAWERGVFSPKPGRFMAGIQVDAPGRLFAGQAWKAAVGPDHPLRMPLTTHPLRSLPLVFLHQAQVLAKHDYDLSLYSYFQQGNRRGGMLALSVASEFLTFVREKYRLPSPSTRIVMIEAPNPVGEIRTVGSILLIPKEYFHNPGVMDRIFLAELSRALAQIWFGESVWSDRDRESWLHLGLSGYLGLDFFHSRFGWNAGIHNLIDWLQPKFREHYYEAPVRSMIRNEKDAPIMLSLTGFPHARPAILAAYNKGPLVIRSLYHVVGRKAFGKTLNALYQKYRYREIALRNFQEEISALSGRNLEPFFRHWFYGKPVIDLSIENWEEETLSGGRKIRVWVRRQGPAPLPAVVRLTTQSGAVISQRWEGESEREVLTFEVTEALAGITIDPDEYWLEIDRKNNYSEIQFRIRPIFDWPKQRELLFAFRGTLGGNSIDGNYVGLGGMLHFNEDNQLVVIPIYGERTGLTNYTAYWHRTHFLLPPLALKLNFKKLNGTLLQGLRFDYNLIESEEHLLKPGIEFRREIVREAVLYLNGNTEYQPRSNANNIRFYLRQEYYEGQSYFSKLTLEAAHSRPNFGSEFQFTTHYSRFNPRLNLNPSHRVDVALIRGGSIGSPPIQMRHELGGPGFMRGYPRVLALTHEEIAGIKLDYNWTFSRNIHGTALQIRKMTAILFADWGRGWENGEPRTARPIRRDAGLGLEFEIDLLRLAQFPLRFEIAYPLNDPEYTEPQIILFGILAF